MKISVAALFLKKFKSPASKSRALGVKLMYMTKHIKLQKDYTASCLYYQIKLPLDIEKTFHQMIQSAC